MDKIALAHSLSCSTDVWDPHVRVFFNLSVPAGEIEREREIEREGACPPVSFDR
jgi:hypothetical protein